MESVSFKGHLLHGGGEWKVFVAKEFHVFYKKSVVNEFHVYYKQSGMKDGCRKGVSHLLESER